MQKFTRALTREIELGGERLAVTLSEEGISVRPVGSRRPPHNLSWAACVCASVGHPSANPSEADVADAVKKLKAGGEKPKADGTAKSGENPAPPKESAPAAAAPAPTADAATLPALLARLDTWLAQHRARFHKALRPGATPEQCNALKAKLPCPLPEELRILLSWHNGQDPDVPGGFEERWALLSADEVADVKRQLDEANPTGWQKPWLPFLDDGEGNCLVLDTGRSPAPVLDYGETRGQHDEVAPSLTAWVHDFVTAVERGEYHEDPERGGFHRAKK